MTSGILIGYTVHIDFPLKKKIERNIFVFDHDTSQMFNDQDIKKLNEYFIFILISSFGYDNTGKREVQTDYVSH